MDVSRCGRGYGEGRGVAAVDEASGQGGEAVDIDKDAGTAELSLLLTLL